MGELLGVHVPSPDVFERSTKSALLLFVAVASTSTIKNSACARSFALSITKSMSSAFPSRCKQTFREARFDCVCLFVLLFRVKSCKANKLSIASVSQ